MNLKAHFELLADYNQWMNAKVYEAAGQLSATEVSRDRGAFFGSILGTLNHIVVGDTVWLKRFAAHESGLLSLREIADLQNPTNLNQIVFDDLGRLAEHRVWLDRQINNWIAELSDGVLDSVLCYHSTKGVPANRRYSSLVLHFFNHQIHHRGQVSTLLYQAGVDVGSTGMLGLIPEESDV